MKRVWRINWIVPAAGLLHVAWALLLLRSDAPLSTVPLAETPFRHHQYLAAAIYGLAGLLAMQPMVKSMSVRGELWCVLPQQFLLMMSCWSALHCIFRSTYADGVLRAWEFIAADQLWGILGAVFHTVSLVDWLYFSRKS